jgi:protoheme IX farnesyltransferase
MEKNSLASLRLTPSSIDDYLTLAKWRLGLGNLLPAAAGFILGSGTSFDGGLFAATLLGLYFVIGSAAVFNNYLDVDIDARMERTRNRPLPAGRISPEHAFAFGAALLFAGYVVLLYYTNTLALGAAMVGFLFYLSLYTPLKRETPHTLWVGAVAGAMPPVVGYTAAAGVFDGYAFLLFIALYLWQIPHSLAISVYRFDEYKKAGIPLFIDVPPTERERVLARKVFRYSLVVLLLGCVAIPLTQLF